MHLTLNIVATVFLVAHLSACGDKGTLALPEIDLAPKDAVRLFPSIDHAPTGTDMSAVHQSMRARYESRVLACSVVRPSKGGSVVNPVYEIELEGNPQIGFLVWRDLIKSDRCNWKLTLVLHRVTHNNAQFDMAIRPDQFDSPTTVFQCVWNTEVVGTRLVGGCGTGSYRPKGADSRIAIRVLEAGA